MKRDFRKPVILAAPKVGLKHPRAVSNLTDLGVGTAFNPILTKNYGSPESSTVVMCSGKVGFDIEERLEKAQLNKGVKLIKVEELAPFPVHKIREELDSAKDVVWV